MSYYMISQYESLDNIAVSKEAKTLYFIQRGTYKEKENMDSDMNVFSNYIYSVEDNLFHAYIAVTSNKDNAIKIQNIYKDEGIETVIKEKIVDNLEFYKILIKYDELLSKTSDSGSIKTIVNQVLSKYEEYVNAKR